MAGNGGAGSLELGDARDQGGVKLQVAVNGKLGCLLVRQRGCPSWTLVGTSPLAEPMVERESMATLGSELDGTFFQEPAEATVDLGKLVGCGVDVHGRQSAKSSVPFSPYSVLSAHMMKNAETSLVPGASLHGLERGAQRVGGGVAGAGDQAVSVAHLDHHGAEVGGIVHLLHGLGQRDALLLRAARRRRQRTRRASLAVRGSITVTPATSILAGSPRMTRSAIPSSTIWRAAAMVRGSSPSGRIDLLPVGLGGGLHTVKKLTHRCCSLLSCGVPLTPLVRSVRGYWPVDCETVPGRPQGSLPIIGASVRINSQIEMRCALRTLSILFGRASRFEVSGPHGALGKDFHGNR